MSRSILFAVVVLFLSTAARAEEEQQRKPSFEIYGFAQVDYIQDFNRMPPDWNATLRPTRIPTTTPNPYGADGEAIFSARQTRLGERSSVPVGDHDLKTRVEFDFWGRGSGAPDYAGQNTIRLRQAYGEWGPVLGGLTASLFMDDDFWPTIVDYWGPDGMAFYRNVQIRYTPLNSGGHKFAVAIERPGADVQSYAEVAPDLLAQNVAPDLTAQYRYTGDFGYVQLSGILRRLGWSNEGATGGKLGYGLNASSTLNVLPNRLKLLVAAVGGQGIENYMNDATPDLAAAGTVAAPNAQAVPVLGLTGYLDFMWTKWLTSAAGYSTVIIWNTSLQPAAAFKQGQYASGNVLVQPFRNFIAGPEFLWGRRDDNGGASGNDFRLQISLRYSFSSLDFWHPS
jgi:hypothetical protein